jgi:hypothetical protein
MNIYPTQTSSTSFGLKAVIEGAIILEEFYRGQVISTKMYRSEWGIDYKEKAPDYSPLEITTIQKILMTN